MKNTRVQLNALRLPGWIVPRSGGNCSGNSRPERPAARQLRWAAWLSLLIAGSLAPPANLRAAEDPPGCSFCNGGLGNTSMGGIGFLYPEAHVGEPVPVIASLGMVAGACRAINATGSVWLAGSPYSADGGANDLVRKTNFLINVTLDPGVLITCPGGAQCQQGPYNVYIDPRMVGAGVNSPYGSVSGVTKGVRVVANAVGTVLTEDSPAEFRSLHAATIKIVTPCIGITHWADYPSGTTCFRAGTNINFTGYVTNCGDIRLTNVVLSDSRPLVGAGFTDLNGVPLLQPLTLDVGQQVNFKGTFTPTPAETYAGDATNYIIASGKDTTRIGDYFPVPWSRAWVTNTTTAHFAICQGADIGLRAYDGSSRIAIEAELGAPTSPLRIAKNGVPFGIKLVATNDPNASRIRIPTSSGIKALKRLPGVPP